MFIEYNLLIIVVIVAIVAYILLKTIKHMIINTLLGFIVLVACNILLGLDIAYTWVVIAICAIGGVAGAAAILLLHYLNVAF